MNSPLWPKPLRPGDPRRAGTYRLEGRLGGGGMGQVFLGRSPGGRPVAVKLVRPELADDPGFRRQFALEAEAARRVGGFYTAQLVDADPDADPPWLVTAYWWCGVRGCCSGGAPNGKQYALGGAHGCSLTSARGTELRVIGNADVDALAFSPDGATLAVADKEGIRLRDAATGRIKATITDRRAAALAFHPDGTFLVSGGWFVDAEGGWLWPLNAT